jgi:hypothetical protein
MAVLHRVERLEGTDSPDLLFFCPGCQCGHGIWTSHPNGITGATWTWNGSMDKPTVSPSLAINFHNRGKDARCHVVITDGKLHFCADCTHQYAGQVVDMVEFG